MKLSKIFFPCFHRKKIKKCELPIDWISIGFLGTFFILKWKKKTGWNYVWGSVEVSVSNSVYNSVVDSVYSSVWNSVVDSVVDFVVDFVGRSVRISVRKSVDNFSKEKLK